jgi:hypothetical protein
VESDQIGTPLTSTVYEEVVRVERCLEQSFVTDVGLELELVDRAMVFLASAMASVDPRPTLTPDEVAAPNSGDVQGVMLFALQAMGARAMRVIRAARASLASGYEAESFGHDRILLELRTHRNALLTDPTGKEAWAWLEAESGRGIGKRVSESAPDGLYPLLSQFAHGDARPLGRIANYETRTLRLAPKRTGMTRTSLIFHASFAADQALLIAGFTGIKLIGHTDLKKAVVTRRKELEIAEQS